MTDSVYLETSVISYLAALPSRDVIVAGRQPLMHDWWQRRRGVFEVVVSELVHLESADGDPAAVARRAEVLVGLRCRAPGRVLPVELEFGAHRQCGKLTARRGGLSRGGP